MDIGFTACDVIESVDILVTKALFFNMPFIVGALSALLSF
jgi:hypothetical protein